MRYNRTLAASVYQRHYAHDFAGRPVPFVPERERAFNAAALAAAKARAADSARPIIGGGLLVAVAKEAIESGVGADLKDKDYSAADLFGEGATAAIYAVPAAKVEEFRRCWKDVPLEEIGVVGGPCLAVGGKCLRSVKALNKAFRNL